MTKKEFAVFIMALKTYYPKENLLQNEQAINLWHLQLKDIPYQIAEASINKWVATNKWSPTIADIREIATSLQNGEIPDWGEAWEEVCEAIRRYGSYRTAEALKNLKPLTRQATERLGFVNLCMSENPTADRANFRIIYEQLTKREKEMSQLPETLQKIISEIPKGKMLEGAKDNK